MAVDFKKALWKKKPRIDLNPSSADRWTTCTASPKFIFDNWDRLPEEDKTFADPGTTAHEVAAALLEGRKVNPSECPVPVEPEMNWHGFNYADYVESLREPGSKLLVEQKLPLFYMENRNAKIDAAVINPKNLHIVDYKYGEGIIVSPENNLQATIYAKSVVWNNEDIADLITANPGFTISIHIYQPRTRDENPFHTWVTTWAEIQELSQDKIAFAAEVIQRKRPVPLEFVPSEKACQWCPAKGFCEARQSEWVKDLEMLAVIDDSPKPLGPVMSMKQLAAIVKHGDHIKKWIDDAQDFALSHMRNGGKLPGFKLVMGRGGNRAWSDPKKAAKILLKETILGESEVYGEPKVIGPAGVEKLLGKHKIPLGAFNLITKAPGSLVIAPEDDPRDNALVDAASEFQNLDEEKSGQNSKFNLDQF